MKKLLLILIILVSMTAPSFCADVPHYAHGPGNWSDTGVNSIWYTATAGGGSQIDPPDSDDTTYLNADSHDVVVTGTAVCGVLNCTGYTGILSGTAPLTITGAFTAVAGMTQNYTGDLSVGGSLTGAGKTYGNVTITNTSTITGTNSMGAFVINASGKTVTLNAVQTCTSFNLMGTTTIGGTSGVTCSGNFTLGASSTIGVNDIIFTLTGNGILTTNNVPLSCNVTINAPGSVVTMGSNFNMQYGTLLLTAGTLHGGNGSYNIYANVININGTSVRTFDMGNAIWMPYGNYFIATDQTNLTFNVGTGILWLPAPWDSMPNFQGGGLHFGTVKIGY